MNTAFKRLQRKKVCKKKPKLKCYTYKHFLHVVKVTGTESEEKATSLSLFLALTVAVQIALDGNPITVILGNIKLVWVSLKFNPLHKTVRKRFYLKSKLFKKF